jgi:hypothetical protein
MAIQLLNKKNTGVTAESHVRDSLLYYCLSQETDLSSVNLHNKDGEKNNTVYTNCSKKDWETG